MHVQLIVLICWTAAIQCSSAFKNSRFTNQGYSRISRGIKGHALFSSQVDASGQTIAPTNSLNNRFFSVLASDPDLNVAMQQITHTCLSQGDIANSANVALLFVSSIYESSAYSYNIIFDEIKTKLPSVEYIIGCTTGCPIGSITPYGDPSEVEARASISLLLGSLSSDIQPEVFSMSLDEIKTYIQSTDSVVDNASDDGGVVLLLASDNAKPRLNDFLRAIEKSEGVQSAVGAVASSVTTLHTPKLFCFQKSSDSADVKAYEKLISGVVGLKLKGNIAMRTIMARSCAPVGPMFEVVEASGKEIFAMKAKDADTPYLSSSPLEQLDTVLQNLPGDQAYSLKRELLVGVVPESPDELTASGASSIFDSPQFFGQKPIAFDPLTGSITVPCLPDKNKEEGDSGTVAGGQTFQFCVRDNPTAREDLQKASATMQSILQGMKSSNPDAIDVKPLALLMIGSMERGNKIFRYQSWESKTMFQTIRDNGFADTVPIAGLFSAGAFTNKLFAASPKLGTGKEYSSNAVMEADALYVLLTDKPLQKLEGSAESASPISVSEPLSKGKATKISDIMTSGEKKLFDDSEDRVIVTKRDPESAHPVRVASMDYFIPEKAPQPSNVLESLVWDREKEIDKMRERFQLARALAQAKASSGKFPSRDLSKYLRDLKQRNQLLSAGGLETPPLLIELVRASVNNGKLTRVLSDISTDEGYANYNKYMSDSAAAIQSSDLAVNIAGIGCHVDSGAFRGQYEDLEIIKKATTSLPVICNDFVIYAYQLFKAKSSGADALKLMCSVLSVQDVSYLVKISKAIGELMCIAVVSSRNQLLDLLAPGAVPGLQAISVTSRNMLLWKIDPMKADSIFADPDVIQAIADKRRENPYFLVFQEGFSSSQELATAKKNGVDAVFLSEELLVNADKSIVQAIQDWVL